MKMWHCRMRCASGHSKRKENLYQAGMYDDVQRWKNTIDKGGDYIKK
jgi:hypothetical protein